MLKSAGRAQALRLLADAGLLAAILWVYHRALLRWLAAHGERLGAIDARQVAPLHAGREAQWHPEWWAPAFLLLALFLWALPRLIAARDTRRLLLAATALFLAIAPAVCMMDGDQVRAGVRAPALVSPYTRDALEYRGDVPAVERAGVVDFLRKYSQPRLFNRLSLHTRTHPPGGVLFQWLVSRLFGPGLWPAALATIAFAALTVPLVYLIAREAHGPAVARVALALFLVTPNFVMFTATSMDGPFSVFPALAVWLFLRALRAARGARAFALLAGLAAATACFMTYAALFLAPLLLLLGALGVHAGWANGRRLATCLAIGGGAALAVYGLLAWVGYDAVAALQASMAHDHVLMNSRSDSVWRHLAIGVANLAAFLIGIGVALSVLWTRATARSVRQIRERHEDPIALTAALTVLAMAFSTLFTLEVERVWLFMVPLVVTAAARYLHALVELSGSLASLRVAAGLQCLQLFGFEALLRTGW